MRSSSTQTRSWCSAPERLTGADSQQNAKLSWKANLPVLGEDSRKRGVESVALESTGVYWIPVHEVLEARGLEVLLVDTRALARVPGRPKTDRRDCQWISEAYEKRYREARLRRLRTTAKELGYQLAPLTPQP